MRKKLFSISLGLVALLVGGMMTPSAFAVYDVYLAARTYTQTMPDTTAVPMWGYERYTDATFTTVLDPVKTPGPFITIPVGETTLTIHLKNLLAEPVSVIIPGLNAALSPVEFTTGPFTGRVRSFAVETAPGATHNYSWTGLRPGSFFYQSGTHPAIQVQMGLFGGVKQDSALNQAYPGNPYQVEQVIFFSEIDPGLHLAITDGTYGTPVSAYQSPLDYKPRYYLINGLQYTLGQPLLAGVAGDQVLVRIFNGGLKTHVPALYGPDLKLIAEDGFPYTYQNGAVESPAPRLQYGALLPAGKTLDALVAVPNPKPREYPFFDRISFPAAAAILPDLNLDGLVNVFDMYILQDYLAGNITHGGAPFIGSLSAADLNRDGQVTAFDLTLLILQLP